MGKELSKHFEKVLFLFKMTHLTAIFHDAMKIV